MSRPLLTAAAATMALLGSAASADAASTRTLPDPIPVPAGQLQHTVIEHSFTSNISSVNSATRIERWATADAGRQVAYDARTGRVTSECVATRTTSTCWNEGHGIRTMKGAGPFLRSWAYEGRLIDQQVDFGWYTWGEDTTFLGRAARTLNDTHTGPTDATNIDNRIVADAETHYPLLRTVTGSESVQHEGRQVTQTFEQVDKVTTFETLSAAGAKLTMRSAKARKAAARKARARKAAHR